MISDLAFESERFLRKNASSNSYEFDKQQGISGNVQIFFIVLYSPGTVFPGLPLWLASLPALSSVDGYSLDPLQYAST